ncbi:hypothetical protein Poli38472_003151 [Pythium oligandrum]|uniref:Peroxin-12 n=1 Tax=Pythium oligandrum TaxID=41045 RepID=A0A8K1FCI4_PYTOL|nr:hypothetical protein Poli38472_003151 [Pythium oligandrum]|eukprot:TMW57226.1 hypothetical protein Poli38472_003151 [Pythium oligandrum]
MMFLEQTQGFETQPTASGGAQSPSLYELLMQERMAGGLRPAVDYLVQTLCDTYPQLSTAPPIQHLEETYALLKCLLERYFLARYDSLSSEKFFGMKRVMYHAAPLQDAASGEAPAATTAPLTQHARRLSLMYAVLMPYLKGKVDHLHRQLVAQAPSASTQPREDEEDRITEASSPVQAKLRAFLRRLKQLSLLMTLKKAFIKGYPFVHLAYEASFFLYQWLYLFGDTPYFSPFLRRMGVILVRVTANDESAFAQKQSEHRDKLLSSLSGSGVLQRVQRGLLRSAWAVYDHSHVLLVLGIAAYKFLEWMYSEDGVATKIRLTGTDAPIPPPPLPPNYVGNASILMSTIDDNKCPLCQRRRVNPAAAISGVVFCYPCIYRHVEAHGECPVTQMKCDVSSIIKIYDDAAA